METPSVSFNHGSYDVVTLRLGNNYGSFDRIGVEVYLLSKERRQLGMESVLSDGNGTYVLYLSGIKDTELGCMMEIRFAKDHTRVPLVIPLRLPVIYDMDLYQLNSNGLLEIDLEFSGPVIYSFETDDKKSSKLDLSEIDNDAISCQWISRNKTIDVLSVKRLSESSSATYRITLDLFKQELENENQILVTILKDSIKDAREPNFFVASKSFNFSIKRGYCCDETNCQSALFQSKSDCNQILSNSFFSDYDVFKLKDIIPVVFDQVDKKDIMSLANDLEEAGQTTDILETVYIEDFDLSNYRPLDRSYNGPGVYISGQDKLLLIKERPRVVQYEFLDNYKRLVLNYSSEISSQVQFEIKDLNGNVQLIHYGNASELLFSVPQFSSFDILLLNCNDEYYPFGTCDSSVIHISSLTFPKLVDLNASSDSLELIFSNSIDFWNILLSESYDIQFYYTLNYPEQTYISTVPWQCPSNLKYIPRKMEVSDIKSHNRAKDNVNVRVFSNHTNQLENSHDLELVATHGNHHIFHRFTLLDKNNPIISFSETIALRSVISFWQFLLFWGLMLLCLISCWIVIKVMMELFSLSFS